MADEDDTAALIVACQIIVPCRHDIAIRHDTVGRARLAGHDVAQGRQRDLAIHRRKWPADGAKRRELHLGDVGFGAVDGQVAVATGIGRNRGIDVKAIDRRGCLGRRRRQQPCLAAGGNAGDCNIAAARIGAAGPAQPVAVLAIIGRGIGRCLRRGRRRNKRREKRDPHPTNPPSVSATRPSPCVPAR